MDIIERLRTLAGLTQRDLARRAGTSQPAIARLEQGRASPTFATLERLAAVAGFELQVELVPKVPADPVIDVYKRDIDRTLLRENLKKSVDERIRSLTELQDFGDEVRRAVRKVTKASVSGLERLLTPLHDAGVQSILVGSVAARAHGSARVTQGVDVSYARSEENLERIVRVLRSLDPYLRGAPPGLPFEWSVATLRAGVNFALTTSAGDIDLLGEIVGGGTYEDLAPHTITAPIFGQDTKILDLPWLIRVKRAAGRPRDLEVIAELEALQEEIVRRDESESRPSRSTP